MQALLNKVPQFLFFTGKGGVGKTSLSCAIAVALADSGKKVLLISTDPASNLSEVLGTEVGFKPTAIKEVANLHAINIDPLQAAHEYKERMVAPYRGVLPEAALEQMQEQLSGACTVEIAGFNEFSKYVGDKEISQGYDHIILDTAPTGHTLRLLSLPSAWNEFIADNQTGSSCLGPVSGLSEYKALYEEVVNKLTNPIKTLLVMVARAEALSLKEAERASKELLELGLKNQHLVLNGVFQSSSEDAVAKAFSQKSSLAIEQMSAYLRGLEQSSIGFIASGVVGLQTLRALKSKKAVDTSGFEQALRKSLEGFSSWEALLDGIERDGKGVVMTMGKGGVGKTTMAALVALGLAKRGHKVTLSTTDPASHVHDVLTAKYENLHVTNIDAKKETQAHTQRVLAKNEGILSEEDMALLKEELSSPCIEEIAVFQAFAKTVAQGEDGFIVLDTAPTGHTLLLLDASEAYHKQMSNTEKEVSEEVAALLPRIRDEKYTKMLITTLAEATPTHEAASLQEDLLRAGIKPYAWLINRNFAVSGTKDELLLQKAFYELGFMNEVQTKYSKNSVLTPYVSEDISKEEVLEKLLTL